MDIEQMLFSQFDPEMVKWVLSKAGLDLKRLTPPHFSEANFNDLNQMAVHYFVMLYPLFMAGCVLYALYIAVMFLYGILLQKIREKMYCSINIKHTNEAFAYINRYLQEKNLIKEDRNLRCAIKSSAGSPWWEEIFKVKDEKAKPEVEFKTGAGDHIFKYKGQTIWVNHSISKPITTGWDNTPTEMEELYVVTYGNDTTILKQFVEECQDFCLDKDKDKITIYELHRWFNGWTKVQQKKPRSLESVILDKNNTQMLCDDIRKFQASEEWYQGRGIPYRRGYLLYGPPGTGKTSFTLAVAGALKLNICYLNLSSGRLDDDDLNDVLSHSPDNSIILLEDIDAIFVQRESVTGGHQSRVTFSGLLNALDGVRSQEGSILFMTTNHREKLDPALLRPGRCDVHVELCNATFPMIKGLFNKFYPGQDEKAKQFAMLIPEKKLSMAKLQGHFLTHRSDPDKAIETYAKLLVDKKQSSEMTIAEWLDRLNMYRYLPMFTKNQVYLMNELKFHRLGNKMNKNFEFKEPLEEMRISQILSGDHMGKENFKFLTESAARRMLIKYIKNEEILEKLVSLIEPDTVTGFQLKDIIIDNFSQEDIAEAITERVELTKQRLQASEDPRVLLDEADPIDYEKETEEEMNKRHGYPKISLEQLFEECNAKKFYTKLVDELDIDDKNFWMMEEKELMDMLAIEPWGTAQRLKMKRSQIWNDFKEGCKKQDKEDKIRRLTKDDKENIRMLLKG